MLSSLTSGLQHQLTYGPFDLLVRSFAALPVSNNAAAERRHVVARSMNEIEKLDNVTWYGHCVIHVMAALNDLPDEAKLDFCLDLSKFIRHQQRALAAASAQ